MSQLQESLTTIKNKFLKRLVYATAGLATYPGIAVVNKLEITGGENLKGLPKQNVLFVSNHQTYFADVIAFIHIFCAFKWRRINKLGAPFYLLLPFTNVYYVAAEETMKGSWISRLFALAGAITVKRTWRAEGKDLYESRSWEKNDTYKIHRALKTSWVITFPQGTTKAFAPGRKGTALIIKQQRPIVVPIVINGFWRAFNKKGLIFKKKGSILTVKIKPPMNINYDDPAEKILGEIMDAIEQSKKFMIKNKQQATPEMAE